MSTKGTSAPFNNFPITGLVLEGSWQTFKKLFLISIKTKNFSSTDGPFEKFESSANAKLLHMGERK